MGLLDGKTAIVTGAARGIGKAIALKFAQEGANIAFTDLVIDENAEATAKEIETLGVKAKAYASNAASFEDTAKVVEAIHADFGRIDILVNNAGITRDGLMMRMTEQQWDMVINVNLKSAFNFIHACTPIMMRQKAGSIINMASVVGVHGNAGQANYSASKAGMIALAKSIAQELGSRGIRANAIAPGFVKTEMTDVLSDEVKENVKEALTELKSVGIKKTIMLTGDSKVVADKVAKAIGIDEVHAELLPSDKVNKVEEILNKKSANGKVLFVGDGINDAPVLARADIGIAMGGVGSDAAIEAADVVLMKDKVEAISEAIRVSRKTSKILWQNIIFSLAIKVAVMILVIFGLTNMWAAVFADVGVTLLAVLNSMRIIR